MRKFSNLCNQHPNTREIAGQPTTVSRTQENVGVLSFNLIQMKMLLSSVAEETEKKNCWDTVVRYITFNGPGDKHFLYC